MTFLKKMYEQCSPLIQSRYIFGESDDLRVCSGPRKFLASFPGHLLFRLLSSEDVNKDDGLVVRNADPSKRLFLRVGEIFVILA